MELEALEAIYGDDYKSLEPGSIFEITLVPEQGAGDDVNHVSIALKVVYTPTYPEAAPELAVRAVKRGALTDEGLAEIEQKLKDAASGDELLGTAMVYALAEICIEWLVENNKPEMTMHEEMMERLRKEEEAKAAAAQQSGGGAVDVSDGGGPTSLIAQHKKGQKGKSSGPDGSWRADAEASSGFDAGTHTPVTVESFAAFRKEWDAQRWAAKQAKLEEGRKKGGRNVAHADEGLTGRQLFERGGLSLIDTDAGALDEDEVDLMSAPREAAKEESGEQQQQAEGEGGASSGGVLASVGDEALFDADDDEDLPDDED